MLAALPPASIESVGRWLTEESARIAAARAQWLSVLAEFDRRGGWGEWGVKSAAHWLELRTGATPPAARDAVCVARALEQLPQTKQAFARGEVHESAVRTIARSATAETEDVLLHFTKYGTGGQVLKLAHLYRRVLTVEDPAFARHIVNRYVRFRYDDDGSLRIYARFPADEGALIRQAVQRVIDEMVVEARRAEIAVTVEPDDEQPVVSEPPPVQDPELRRLLGLDEPEPSTVPDDADNDEADADDEADDRGGRGVPIYDDSPRAEQYNADALLTLLTSSAASEPSNADRYLANLHIDLATLKGQAGRCELDGIPIPGHIGRMLACDASLVAIVEDEHGRPLEVSRRQRAVTKKLEIALKSRDQTCRMPECHARRHLHVHHVQQYVITRRTRLSDVIRLCGMHHRAYHAGAFEISIVGPGEVEFVDRRGDVIERITLAAPDGDLASEQSHLQIDHDTCRPRYAGGRPDYSVAIDHLLARCGLVNLKVTPPDG